MRLIQTAADDGLPLPEPENSSKILQNRRKRSRFSTSRGRRVDRAASFANPGCDEHKLGDECEDDGRCKASFNPYTGKWFSMSIKFVDANQTPLWIRGVQSRIAQSSIDLPSAAVPSSGTPFFVYPGIDGVRRASLLCRWLSRGRTTANPGFIRDCDAVAYTQLRSFTSTQRPEAATDH